MDAQDSVTALRPVLALIAGGSATRMGGAHKPSLRVGNETIFARQFAVLGPLCVRAVVVGPPFPEAATAGLSFIPDRVSRAGPLAGIEAALSALGAGEHAALCVAGDLPFPSASIAKALLTLLANAGAVDAAVPRSPRGPEPLFAVYRPSCLPKLRARLARGHYQANLIFDELCVAWLEGARLRALDRDELAFVNVNTPDILSWVRTRGV